MYHTDGMALMEHRTTFTLDASTIQLLKTLSRRWHVSQAEVVRRAVARAEAESRQEHAALAARLRDYQYSSALSAENADRYLEEVAELRTDWGR